MTATIDGNEHLGAMKRKRNGDAREQVKMLGVTTDPKLTWIRVTTGHIHFWVSVFDSDYGSFATGVLLMFAKYKVAKLLNKLDENGP